MWLDKPRKGMLVLGKQAFSLWGGRKYDSPKNACVQWEANKDYGRRNRISWFKVSLNSSSENYSPKCCNLGVGGEGGRAGSVSKEIGGSDHLPVWRHVTRQWLSKWQVKCSSKRRIKISNFSRKYCSDFLHLEFFKIPIVIENKSLVLFWNETSSGVMNCKDSFLSSSKFYGQSYRPVTLFEGQCTARLRSLDTAMGGLSKDISYFTSGVFSALQSWWNPISILSKVA